MHSALRKNACGDAAIRAQPKVHCLAVSIDCPVEVVPSAPNADVGLINPPGRIYASYPPVPSLLELQHVVDNPAQNRFVRDDDSALGHHREIPIAQPVSDVPANALLDDLGIEPAPPMNWQREEGLVLAIVAAACSFA